MSDDTYLPWRQRPATQRMAILCIAFLVGTRIFYTFVNALYFKLQRVPPMFEFILYETRAGLFTVTAWGLPFIHILLALLFLDQARRAQTELPRFWSIIVACWLLGNGLTFPYSFSTFFTTTVPDDFLASQPLMSESEFWTSIWIYRARFLLSASAIIGAVLLLIGRRGTFPIVLIISMGAPVLWAIHLAIQPSAAELRAEIFSGITDPAEQANVIHSQTLGTISDVFIAFTWYACLAAATFLLYRKRLPLTSQPAHGATGHP